MTSCRCAHRRCGVERTATDEDREPAKGRLRIQRQEAVAPGEGVTQRALARRQVTRSPSQQRHPRLVEPCEERLGRERLAARRRQFDGEGQSIEALADRGDDACVGGVEGEVWADRASALDEEIHRGDGGQCCYGGRLGGGGQRKRRERILVLAEQAQRRAARREDFEAGTGGEEVGNQRRRREHVLEVIKQQEYGFVSQVTLPATR